MNNKAQAELDKNFGIAAFQNNTEGMRLMLASGADVNYVMNTMRETPLHYAAKYGNTKGIQMLISAGADVNAGNMFGWTPLHQAAYHGYAGSMCLLIKAGADVNIKDDCGETPADILRRNCGRKERDPDAQADELWSLILAAQNLNGDARGTAGTGFEFDI